MSLQPFNILSDLIETANRSIEHGKGSGWYPNPLTVMENVLEKNEFRMVYLSADKMRIFNGDNLIGVISLTNSGRWEVSE